MFASGVCGSIVPCDRYARIPNCTSCRVRIAITTTENWKWTAKIAVTFATYMRQLVCVYWHIDVHLSVHTCFPPVSAYARRCMKTYRGTMYVLVRFCDVNSIKKAGRAIKSDNRYRFRKPAKYSLYACAGSQEAYLTRRRTKMKLARCAIPCSALIYTRPLYHLI